MKKLIIVVISIIALLFISDKLYKSYRLHYLTNDRAVLFIYINIKNEDYVDYFNIDKNNIENPTDFFISCVVPDYENSFLINCRNNYPLNNINCNLDYDFNSQYELKKSYAKGHQLILQLKNKNTGKKIAEKNIFPNWIYGKINHIIVEKDKEYKYCSN